MTRTELETMMARMPKRERVDDESLVCLLAAKACEDATEQQRLNDILMVLLTAAKSRGMNLHALKDNGGWIPRKTYEKNIYELLKVATSERPINSKLIILIGRVIVLLS